MKREIIFRGKVKYIAGLFGHSKDKADGEWVYGDLERHRIDELVRIHCYTEDKTYYRQYDVDADTVGQYTGLEDCNGVKIFEGDILDVIVFDCFGNDKQYKVRVEWCGSQFLAFDVNSEDTAWELGWLCNQDEEIEVIGNIYDDESDKK